MFRKFHVKIFALFGGQKDIIIINIIIMTVYVYNGTMKERKLKYIVVLCSWGYIIIIIAKVIMALLFIREGEPT